MPIPVLMPALSPTMTDGTLARWLKQAGDPVAAGDVIAEIETDKATMEVEAVDDGTFGKTLVEEGSEGVPVNSPIALLLADGESEADLDKFEVPTVPTAPMAPAAEKAPAVPVSAGGNGAAAPAPIPATGPAPSQTSARPPVAATGGRIFASPLARRLAAQKGIDLVQLSGSGPHGRIVKIDIENYQPGVVGRAPVSITGDAPFELVPHTNMRKIIATRLTQSKQTVPHFYLTVDMDIGRLLDMRAQVNETSADGFKVSVNDIVIMAAGHALMEVPAANASWSDDGLLQYARADISVAVAIEGGLITPIIRGANAKSLTQISVEMKDLAARAREGRLQPDEYQGGTFSISNLGMYGIREFAAVINPPQGCILAVGAGEERAVVRDGAIGVATLMTCTLSVDHRAVDGAAGSEYLAALKKNIENPVAMLV
ncbi:MAG: pyruvate dehydrogenase complex dihydrolipoamide acetyltransferase [Alphaproteobacteria bacterium]|nr:pyruvate dehydrogenase complex dihydrolipoamide acetyltransferase [Alphaproteobacteria bacterium]